MVDLPGHLAITRVLDDYVHGKYRDALQLNLDPVHKPVYALLYGAFLLLPTAAVGPVAMALLVASLYAAVCYGIAALGRRSASSPVVVALALAIALFSYGSAFFWGLIPFMLSAPPALVAYVCYLRLSGAVESGRGKVRTSGFLAAALIAHVVHPLASFFLGLMLAPAAAVTALWTLGGRGGASSTSRLWTIAKPLVAWAALVAIVHLLTAPGGHERDLAGSLPGLAAPFHGLTEARAFLRQIPIELDMLPTRDRTTTRVAYSIGVAALLGASLAIALAASLLSGARNRPASAWLPPVARLAAVLVPSVLVFLFVRHDLIRISRRLLWFPVRGPTFLVFFFGVLAAALVVRALAPLSARILPAVIVACSLALAAERSAVLRTHFLFFDEKVHAFFAGEMSDRWFYSQPFGYADHIRTYNCFFDDACDLSRLFFAIYPEDATIYPVSRAPEHARFSR